MKWIHALTIAAFLACSQENVQSGLFRPNGGIKGTGCAESCQPQSCKPTITRPCHTTVHNYQRRCANVKPICGSGGCGADNCCAPTSCSVPQPCGVPNSCSVPVSCEAPGACGAVSCCVDSGCVDSCSGSESNCSWEDVCAIEKLIRESQAACYATERRDAIHRLGDHYDCVCHPQIMNAFIYALNDSDERVRAKSADEIGDQIRRNRCCCGAPVIRALQHALADCDRGVRRQAEEALQLSGYNIVNARCRSVCWSNQTQNSGPAVRSTNSPQTSADSASVQTTPDSKHTTNPEQQLTAEPTTSQGNAQPVPPTIPNETQNAPIDGASTLTPSPSDAEYDEDPAPAPAADELTAPQSYFPSELNHGKPAKKRSVLAKLFSFGGK